MTEIRDRVRGGERERRMLREVGEESEKERGDEWKKDFGWQVAANIQFQQPSWAETHVSEWHSFRS
jgi:hypothetical protein